MHNHKIRNVSEYEPEIIAKTIQIFGQDGYETTYRKLDTIEYLCDDDNDTSGMQNEQVEDRQIDERDDANDTTKTQGGCKETTTDTWTFTPPWPRQNVNKEEKTVHCQYCSESFFYESGLRTYMEHTHVKEKANEDTILAEKIARQEKVLSTIPKTEAKKRRNNKKEKGKGKKS